MIAIVDYGVGNLFSLSSSLNFIGAENEITADREKILSADRLILPGVGAFSDAIAKLRALKLDVVVKEFARSGKSLLGICLGMQLLFERSLEYGEHRGLGLIKGYVAPLSDDLPDGLKVPQIGWNEISLKSPNLLFKYSKSGDYVYFVHSYYAKDCGESLLATADYGIPVTAAVGRKNVFGTQFHPEKSGEVGLNILRAFCEIEPTK